MQKQSRYLLVVVILTLAIGAGLLCTISGSDTVTIKKLFDAEVPHSTVAALMDTGGLVLIGDTEGKLRLFRHGQSNQPIAESPPSGSAVRSIKAAEDGCIAVGYANGEIATFDLKLNRLQTLKEHKLPVWALAFFEDGSRLASGSRDGSIVFWETKTWQKIAGHNTHAGNVTRLVIAANGNCVVSGGNDGLLRLWDASGNEVSVVSNAHTGPVTCLALSPSGRQVASGGADGLVILWQLDGMRITRTSSIVQGGYLQDINFVSDDLVVSTSANGTLCIVKQGDQGGVQKIHAHNGGCSSVQVLSPSVIVTAGGDGHIRFWNVPELKPLAEYRSGDGLDREVFVAPNTGNVWVIDNPVLSCLSVSLPDNERPVDDRQPVPPLKGW